MTLRAGFVGLGNIGKPMAGRLPAAGFATTIYDIAEAPVAELVAAGAKAAGTPGEVAERSDVVGVCVPEDEQVRTVVLGEDGLLAGAAPGMVIAVHSTVLPSTVEALAAPCAERGVHLVDACVTGGAARAEQGQLTYLVGGTEEQLAKLRPFLEASAEKVIHAGPLGSGCKLKLCINLVTYLQWTAAFEAVKLANAVGLPQQVLEEAGRANGQITELMIQYMGMHKLPPEARRSEGMQRILRGHMNVAEKDLAWVLKLAREAGVTLPGAALVSQLMGRVYCVEDEGRR